MLIKELAKAYQTMVARKRSDVRGAVFAGYGDG
jgi:hypothetical protein